MALAVLGILLLLLLAATALRYFINRPLNRYDRTGAFVYCGRAAGFFRWIGLDFSVHSDSDDRFGSLADISVFPQHVRFVPCVDGSELARAFFTFAALVGAAMCSAC
jgi:hypothetical protein